MFSELIRYSEETYLIEHPVITFIKGSGVK